MEPEICGKMLKNLSEKLAAKFPATALRYSMVEIAHLNDAFSECFELEKAQQKVNHCAERQRKGEKKKQIKKLKSLKTWISKFWFLHMPN